MAISRIPKSKKLLVQQQAYFIASKYANCFFDVVNFKYFICRIFLKPTPLSENYEVEIRYDFNFHPKVKVISPKIEGPTPHMYLENFLCTHYKSSVNWKASQKISDVIVPWICDWLFYYEIWKCTGKWIGEADPRHTGRLGHA